MPFEARPGEIGSIVDFKVVGRSGQPVHEIGNLEPLEVHLTYDVYDEAVKIRYWVSPCSALTTTTSADSIRCWTMRRSHGNMAVTGSSFYIRRGSVCLAESITLMLPFGTRRQR